MELWRLWVLRGPNAWATCPVLEAGVVPSSRAERTPEQLERLVEQLVSWLPSLSGHLSSSAHLGEIIARLTLELQRLAGNPVTFAETRKLDSGRWRLAIEYQEEPVGRACLQTALALCRVAEEGQTFPIEEELLRLRDLADDQVLGPSTLALVLAARARGIPVDHLNPDDGRYLQLGHGARQRRSLASETDDISAVARSVTTDKHLTKEFLRLAGVPVPHGRTARDAEDAWTAACELGLPVAVKPQDRDLAVGVGLDLRTRDQVLAAYQAAREKSANIIVERFAPGVEHRVLVVDGRVVAVARIEPPHVVGDGQATVAELVNRVNSDPRRGTDYRSPLRRLKLDATALEVLAGQGYTLESVPPAGQRVLVRRNPPYIKNGGSLIDLTDRIHPQVAARAVDAARALRLRVAGLDVVVEDISRPLEEQGGIVVEVNTGPGLWLHMAPWADTPRPVGEAIMATLFPSGSDGRIPLIALTGGPAHAEAGRRVAELLARRGLCVGRASGAGVCIGEREIPMPSTTAADRALAVLRSTVAEAAVLEAPAADLLQQGLGCDRCDVAVITDLPRAADTTGTPAELEDACVAVLHALLPEGRAVLNADDPPTIPGTVPVQRIVWFSTDGQNRQVRDHRAAGGTAVLLDAGALVLAWGAEEERIPLSPSLRELDRDRQVGLLAAVAAGLALGLDAEEVRAALVTA